MTIFFRRLADATPTDLQTSLQQLNDASYRPELTPEHQERLAAWLNRYFARLIEDDLMCDERRAAMNAVNPKYVLRNYLAQQAIDLATTGDVSMINELLEVLRRPYDEQPEAERFFAKRPDWARQKAGCSMLSCSS